MSEDPLKDIVSQRHMQEVAAAQKAITKQISRYEAERVATLLEGFDVMTEAARERAATRAAAMLRSLMDRVEEAEGHCMSVERQMAKVADLEIKLAAANERAEKAEGSLQHLASAISLTLTTDFRVRASQLEGVGELANKILSETDQ